jgi:hypothetical protein
VPELFLPIGARMTAGADNELTLLCLNLHTLTEASLLQQRLGDADALRVADLDDTCLHSSAHGNASWIGVITL